MLVAVVMLLTCLQQNSEQLSLNKTKLYLPKLKILSNLVKWKVYTKKVMAFRYQYIVHTRYTTGSFSAIPSGPVYRAASFIRLTCSATGGVPPLQYHLIGSCRQIGIEAPHEIFFWPFSLLITTTPRQCRDQFMCQVTNSCGNNKTAQFIINELTGMACIQVHMNNYRLSTGVKPPRKSYNYV